MEREATKVGTVWDLQIGGTIRVIGETVGTRGGALVQTDPREEVLVLRKEALILEIRVLAQTVGDIGMRVVKIAD